MRIASTFLVPASPERVWTLLLDPEARRASVPGCEALASLASSLRVESRLDLRAGAGTTEVRYQMDVSLWGRLGALGESVFRGKATELGGEFSQRLTARLESSGAGS